MQMFFITFKPPLSEIPAGAERQRGRNEIKTELPAEKKTHAYNTMQMNGQKK